MKIVMNLLVVAVVAFFAYILISLYIRDVKNKKIKDDITSNGVDTVGEITQSYGRSGGNSGFINVTLSFKYEVDNGEVINNSADAVINSMDVQKYQPGEKINLRYSRTEPKKVILDIPNPLLRRKKG
ncbi:hypothetical protein NG99_25825 [Erwinia typographi]|uniref:DUF3592 domain-containing protein n=1 Tax=Erwinia typographi TaxID=371042 RepID=A0A0A3YIC3_9GAMM|nr:DUF3592 domain-containing protein [Erwinia typographi]KGT86400.1 hypothetical protein NG99_25825 [Erwinia typographi]